MPINAWHLSGAIGEVAVQRTGEQTEGNIDRLQPNTTYRLTVYGLSSPPRGSMDPDVVGYVTTTDTGEYNQDIITAWMFAFK